MENVMKKVIALLAVLFGLFTLAHATPSPIANASLPTPESVEQPVTPTDSDADKIGNGSGDDVDTANEADPSNDNDPEADDGSDR
jgi:hypothetical protein